MIKLQDLKPDWFDGAIVEYVKIPDQKISGEKITVFNQDEFKQDKWKILGNYPKVINILQQAMLSFLKIENFTRPRSM